MTRCWPGFGLSACALLAAGLLAWSPSQAACSDKTLREMADAGRSVSTISKRCGMTAAAVKERLDAGAPKTGGTNAGETKGSDAKTSDIKGADPLATDLGDADGKPGNAKPSRAPSAAAASSTSDAASKPPAKPAAAPQKHPPGTILELCGCYGSTPYGFTESNDACLSGKAVATRCPGYCPVNQSPWRRICS